MTTAAMAPRRSPSRMAMHRRRHLAEARIGVVPIIWNNADLPGLAPRVPWQAVLDEIERLGYEGTQRGIGFPSARELVVALEQRGLRLAEIYVSLPCGPDGPAGDALDLARRGLQALHDANGDVLIVALAPSSDRDPYVGRAKEAPRLSDRGMEQLGELLDVLGRDVARLGHRLGFHNHAATYIETGDELENLLAVTQATQVGLCLDVGHAILGGADPVRLLERHADRLVHVHLKDVDPEPLAALRGSRLTGFAAALEERIFTPLGSGVLDLPAVLRSLDRHGYRGWLMVEQDTSWEPASEAAAIGRRVLEAALRWMAADAMEEVV